MSFWDTTDGTKATGHVEESGGFAPLPLADYPVMLEDAKVNEYEGRRTVQFKTRIIEGFGKNRVVFLSLKAWDEDGKKRDRALQILAKVYALTNATLPEDEPDDVSLSQLCDKPLTFKLDVYDINGKTGNWLVNVKEYGAKADAPKATGGKPKAVVASRPAPEMSDQDLDIPF